jgi:hypothetical protein
MVLLGLLLGFGAAASNTFGFFLSRSFVIGRPRADMQLLAMSHVIMAAMSLVLVAVLWTDKLLDWWAYAWPLTAVAGFYLVGQGCVFFALRHTETSRVSPLLGLKILVMAIMTLVMPPLAAQAVPTGLTALQWGAVALSVAAAFVLNYSGGSIPTPAILGVLLACVTYSLSDWYTPELIETISETGQVEVGATILATGLMFIFSAVAGLPLLLKAGPISMRDWGRATPFSLMYFASMMLFFGCLATAGPLLANIVLSTRGLMAIGAGFVIAHLGHEHLETKVSRGVLVRRGVASAMMLLAIWAYASEKAQKQPPQAQDQTATSPADAAAGDASATSPTTAGTGGR